MAAAALKGGAEVAVVGVAGGLINNGGFGNAGFGSIANNNNGLPIVNNDNNNNINININNRIEEDHFLQN